MYHHECGTCVIIIFGGIHVTPSLYRNEFGLDINNIPDYFQDFKLTLHFGGLHNATTDHESYEHSF